MFTLFIILYIKLLKFLLILWWFPDHEAAAAQVRGAAIATTKSPGDDVDTPPADPSATPAVPHPAGG